MNVQEEAQLIRNLWSGFMSARVLLTANNFKVFEILKASRTAEEVATAAKADARGMETLLDAITSLGLLKKSGRGYQNSSLAERFLVMDSPYYLGDIIRHAATLWENWSDLDTVVKTGKPSRKSQDHTSFILGMQNLAVLKASKVVKAVDVTGVKKALDLGGGPGTYSMEMARKGAVVTLFDLPETIAISRELIRASSVSGTILYREGDFLSDPIGEGYDLVFVSQILHSLGVEECVELLRKCYKAINVEGGRIAVHDFSIKENRAFPPESALFSVNMLVNTERGRCYPAGEIKGFLVEAGFTYIRDKVIDDTVVVTGVKR
jgi:ubiquinone/menaquinone biosynthesis C-methylase UbiE